MKEVKQAILQPQIEGIENEQGEKIDLINLVVMEDTLDVWCSKLEKEMALAVNKSCQDAFNDNDEAHFLDWIKRYPTQMLLVALDARFARALENMMGNQRSAQATLRDDGRKNLMKKSTSKMSSMGSVLKD